MEFAQNLFTGENLTLLLLTVGCCAVGIVGFFVLQFVGGVLDIVSGVMGLVFGVLGGGPVAWCGCALVLMLLCGCGFMVYAYVGIIPSCGTANAVNLCRLFGY